MESRGGHLAKLIKVNRSLRKIQTALDSVQGVEGGLNCLTRYMGVRSSWSFYTTVWYSKESAFLYHEDAFVRSQCNMDEDALKVKSYEGCQIKLEEGIETNQARPEGKKDKDLCVCRFLSSLALANDGNNTRTECINAIAGRSHQFPAACQIHQMVHERLWLEIYFHGTRSEPNVQNS
ncbi:unnamed protein product [Brassica napus]|nr:unnamed protein product [Brassica napus]VDD57832.1 unnamed protein product [Brassica oleracea]